MSAKPSPPMMREYRRADCVRNPAVATDSRSGMARSGSRLSARLARFTIGTWAWSIEPLRIATLRSPTAHAWRAHYRVIKLLALLTRVGKLDLKRDHAHVQRQSEATRQPIGDRSQPLPAPSRAQRPSTTPPPPATDQRIIAETGDEPTKVDHNRVRRTDRS